MASYCQHIPKLFYHFLRSFSLPSLTVFWLGSTTWWYLLNIELNAHWMAPWMTKSSCASQCALSVSISTSWSCCCCCCCCQSPVQCRPSHASSCQTQSQPCGALSPVSGGIHVLCCSAATCRRVGEGARWEQRGKKGCRRVSVWFAVANG